MAKFTPGPLAGAISGGVGNTVFTRNRYGSVLRIGVIPTLRTTTSTIAARGLLSTLSKAWAALDAGSRASWTTWAQSHPIVDALGQSQVLQGSAAFVGLNCRVIKSGGSMISTPPVAVAPSPISGTVALTAATPSTCALAWTSGALAAGCVLETWVAIVPSAGRAYYKNQLVLVNVSAAAATTPLALGTVINTRLGYFKAGWTIHTHNYVVDQATGLRSGVVVAQVVVSV